MLAEISETLLTVVRNIADMLLYDAGGSYAFPSGLFWLLFIFFLPVYALLKKSKTKMVVFVVGFSLYFYYKSSGLFFLMLIGTSLVDWLCRTPLLNLRGVGRDLQ